MANIISPLINDIPPLSCHTLFDVQFYLRQVDNCQGLDPISHYLTIGHQLNIDPHPLFSSKFYTIQTGELVNQTPLEHYITIGHKHNLNPHPVFDGAWYRSRYMGSNNEIPLVHYLKHGIANCNDPHPLFSARKYVWKHPETSKYPGGPVAHAVAVGRINLRDPYAGFSNEDLLSKKRKEIILSNIYALLVFNEDAVSGGIFSIFSIADELYKSGINTCFYSMPGQPIVRYSRFHNNHIILSFDDLLTHLRRGHIGHFFVPETLLARFMKVASDEALELSATELVILNQHSAQVPPQVVLNDALAKFESVKMTTAHERYSTQQHSNTWGVPIKHISTYMAFEDYTVSAFEEKEDLIILSPDRIPLDERILNLLKFGLQGYRLFRVENVHYELFKYAMSNSKFTITLGEGLDNYFIETFFTGGIAFTIYNPRFMPEEMRKFPNVFSGIKDLVVSLPSVIRDIELFSEFRQKVMRLNYNYLSEIYCKEVYHKKLAQFVKGEIDFFPKEQ